MCGWSFFYFINNLFFKKEGVGGCRFNNDALIGNFLGVNLRVVDRGWTCN